MDNKQIEQALNRLFQEDKERIVFWNDPEREFQNEIPFLDLGGVNLIRLDEMGALEVKCLLEKGDPEGKYLLYAPTEEPDYENDWLYDIRCYSYSFRADKASFNLKELGLTQQRMRAHIEARRKFFDNKERIQKLKTLVDPNDDEPTLDRKMIAVVCRADQPELFNIVRTLFHLVVLEGGDLENPPAAWEQIEKLDLDAPFWQMVQSAFGYAEQNPSLRNLLIRMLLSEFNHQLHGDVPASFQHLLLSKPGTANAVVCLAQWRDSSSTAASYDELSEQAARGLSIEEVVADLDLDVLKEVVTFLDVEKAIVRSVRDRVRSTAETVDAQAVREIVRRRQDGHWASPKVSGAASVPRAAINGAYAALEAAADFFALRNVYRDGFPFADASDLYQLYVDKLFQFDQFYRHFCEAADCAEKEGWGLLKPLRDDIEAAYCNWYLTRLSLDWGKCVAAGLLDNWRIPNVYNQQNFFDRHVRPQIEGSDRFRVFVVISDAFRYEAAQELHGIFNGEYRLQAELSTQLGVLPSYTALGMASLLPGKVLTYGDAGDVTVDGKSTASIEDRNAILASVGGIAVKADDLLAMKKDDGRARVSGTRVVYIYHNVIDAVGDMASTEDDTFEAVRRAVSELVNLVRYIINNLNGNHVVVTSDHGFLFTESPPSETDKSKLSAKPAGTVIDKKRYLIGRDLGTYEDAWHGKTKNTAGADGDMEFWIPKGANRFHFAGGARFIHGGAMPQEIVVPVITVKHLKDKSPRQKTKSKTVTVIVLGATHRITTPRHRFQLLQMEQVSDRVKRVTLKVAVYEGDDPVTNIETVTFDSVSDNMSDRQKDVYLVLQDRPYDKRTSYRLVLRDADTGIEQQSVNVIIDRAIADDF